VNKIKDFGGNFLLTFADFKNFLIRPNFEKTRFTLGGFLGATIIFFIIVALQPPFNMLLDFSYPELKANYILGTVLEESPSFSLLIEAAFLGPIIEEFYYRSWMSRNKWCNIFLLACTIDFGVSYFVSLLLDETETSSLVDSFIQFGNLGISLLLAHFLVGEKQYLQSISEFIRKRSALLFYYSCICFAATHISNYENIHKSVLLVAQLPLFGLAVIWGYIRIRYGLLYSMLFHILYNSAQVF
jgi:hypothetical protein